MTALHAFGTEMLKLSRGLESVSVSAGGSGGHSGGAAGGIVGLTSGIMSMAPVARKLPPPIAVPQQQQLKPKPSIATIDHQLAAMR